MSIENEIDITADLGAGAEDGYNADTVTAQPAPTAPVEPRTDAAVTPAVEAPKDALSIRDQLSKAFSPEAEAAKPNTTAAPALTQGEDGRWRRLDGTFASESEVAALIPPAQQNTTQGEIPASILSQMTEIEKSQVAALPAETRDFLLRKMEAVEGQAARYGEYGLLESELIGPRRQAWAANGMTPAVAMQQLFALSDFASRDPTAFVLWYADQNKVDLDAALDARDAQQGQVDPHVVQLRDEIGQLRNTVSTYEQQQQQAAFARNSADIEAFAGEKDAAGNLKNPYLTEVVNEFSSNIQAIRAQNPTAPNADVIRKAYENACWSNPNVRSRMQKAADDARIAEQRAQAARASAASGSINGGPSGTVLPKSPENSNLTLREELARQFG